jgi:PAS domain S-box-containing protein
MVAIHQASSMASEVAAIVVTSDGSPLPRLTALFEPPPPAVTLDALGDALDGTDCVVCPTDLAGGWRAALERTRARAPDAAFVLVAADGDGERTVDVCPEGVFVSVPADVADETLRECIERAAAHAREVRELREGMERYQMLVEESSEAVFVYQHGRFRFVNDRTCEMTGYRRSELLEMDPWALIHPADRERLAALAHGEVDEPDEPVEARVVSADGTVREMVFNGRSVTFDGDPALLTVVRDVTERNRLTRELREQAEHLSTIGSNLPVVLFALDAEGRFLALEGEGLDPLDIESEELVGQSVFEVFPESPEYLTLFERVFDGESVNTVTEPGDAVFEAWIEPVHIDGEVERVVGVGIELTERHENEQALRESEARYRTLLDVFDTSEVGTFIIDADLTVVWASRAIETFFGVDRDRLIGRSKPEVLTTQLMPAFEDPDAFRETVLRTYAADAPTTVFEYHVLPGDGREERWLKHWSRPIERGAYAGGRIEHYTDVSELVAKERSLEAQNERLEEFTSIVSHDLRNPLAVANGSLLLYRETGETGNLDRLDSAIERMDSLIGELLTLAREGLLVGDLDAVSLPEVARRAWEAVTVNGATLELETDLVVVADPSRLQEFLENLFSNAIKHVGESVAVRLTSVADGFAVEDDGPGIPAAERERVFGPGYTTAETGTGFGLAIVRRIAEAHGWTVGVEASDLGGARFVVTGVEPA